MVLADGALEGADGVGGRRVVVIDDDLHLAAVDAALGVDLVGGKLCGLRDRRTGDRLRLGDHPDLDRRLGGQRRGRKPGQCDHASGGTFDCLQHDTFSLRYF